MYDEINKYQYLKRIVSDSDFHKIAELTGKIKSNMSKASNSILNLGNFLLEAKEILDHGTFGTWLKEEFALGERTAQRLMRISKHFKTDKLSDVGTPARTLYLITSGSMTDAERNAFTDRVVEGKEVSHEEVSQAVEEKKQTEVMDAKEAILDEEDKEGSLVKQVPPEDERLISPGPKSKSTNNQVRMSTIEKLNTAINLIKSLTKKYESELLGVHHPNDTELAHHYHALIDSANSLELVLKFEKRNREVKKEITLTNGGF